MPDLNEHVENWQLGYVLDRNKKYTIETDIDLRDAWQHFNNGYQMWLDPLPVTAAARKSQANVNAEGNLTIQSLQREDKVIVEMEALKKLYGNQLPPYKYRLWAEMIIVGTATKESMPDVPMFAANPAKRPKRETIQDTLTTVGQTIVSALTPSASSSKGDEVRVEQV